MKKLFAKIGSILKDIGEIISFTLTNKNDSMVNTPTPQKPTPVPVSSPVGTPIVPNIDTLASNWNTQQNNYHNVRVLCDWSGLSLSEKNDICACIYQESEFFNYLPNALPVKHDNIVKGEIVSTDWGICQWNDYYHVGPNKEFATVQALLSNPQRAVELMIESYKAGDLKEWVSYSSGAYKQWLVKNSPMWALAQK